MKCGWYLNIRYERFDSMTKTNWYREYLFPLCIIHKIAKLHPIASFNKTFLIKELISKSLRRQISFEANRTSTFIRQTSILERTQACLDEFGRHNATTNEWWHWWWLMTIGQHKCGHGHTPQTHVQLGKCDVMCVNVCEIPTLKAQCVHSTLKYRY
jgi:hypothetical protein